MKPLQFRLASWAEAKAFVIAHHRHHGPPQGYILAIAATHRDKIVGVAIVGRPVSRVMAARGYLEVTRTCTVTWGVNRELYRRAAQFAPIITYTMDGETGQSLVAAGWVKEAHRTGRPSDWNSPARRREGAVPAGRTRWAAPLAAECRE